MHHVLTGFQGYHVQVTARSDRDLTPEGIIQKVADSSGSLYSAGDVPPPVANATKPAVSSKPAFTPTQSQGVGSDYNRLPRTTPSFAKDTDVDDDGWGHDAPPVTRTQLEKVQSAYQPTKINMRDFTSQQQAPSTIKMEGGREDTGPEVIKGAYQPVGKVDIAAIRRQAKESGSLLNDRPETVRGSYEPVGKVDIAAMRARAQKPLEATGAREPGVSSIRKGDAGAEHENNRPTYERSSQHPTGERLTALPKPKTSNKFGGGTSFTGTKAPTPAGFGTVPAPSASSVGTASRTFADKGGKTPAQIWAEKKARERGQSGSGDAMPTSGSSTQAPLASQTSGGSEWKSGYTGKSWTPIQTTLTGKSASSSIGQQRSGDREPPTEEEAQQSPIGGIGSIRDRFSGAPPMGAPAPVSNFDRPAPEPDVSNKPNRGRGIPIPGFEAKQLERDNKETPSLPTPPLQPRSPTPPTPDAREDSPIRVAMPVGRGAVTDAREEQLSPPPVMAVKSIELAGREADADDDEPEPGPDPARAAAQATAANSFGADAVNAQPGAGASGKRAVVEYDYEKAEDNEVELKEGEYVTNIEMVDEDWWMGQNAAGEIGLFPSNYVKLVEDDEPNEAAVPQRKADIFQAPTPSVPAAGPPRGSTKGPTATALFDYEAAGE